MSMESTTAGQPGALRCSERASIPHKTSKSAVAAPQLVTVQRHPALPFLTVTQTKRGRAVSWCDFDVPVEDYAQGWRTGTMVCAMLFKHLCDGGGCDLLTVVKDAAKAVAESNDQPSRRGAGVGFFRALEALVRHAAGTDALTHSSVVLNQAMFHAERSAARWANEKAAKAAKASAPRVRRASSTVPSGAAQ